VTYGQRSKSIFSSPFQDIANDQTELGVFGGIPGTAPNEAAWNLEGTIRNNYAQHDPRVLFPQPSSTVPNATPTQQRILEGVAAPTLLGFDSEADATPYLPPSEPQVPWSDLMNLSPPNHEERSDSSNKPHDCEPTVPQLGTPPELTVSQRSRRGSSLKGSPLRHEIVHENFDPLDVLRPPVEPFSSQDLGFPPAASANTRDSPDKSRRTSHKNKATELLPSSEDDLTAIGLPSEQYRPRPSRSRSLKVDTHEPVDYSVRPEKAGKLPKRRKTTTAAGSKSTLVEGITTPQKVRQICDMGFAPSATERALTRNNGDVTQTVHWLIKNGTDEDELAPGNTPKRQPSSRARKSFEDAESVEHEAKAFADNQETDLVKVADAGGSMADHSINEPDVAPDHSLSVTKLPTKSRQMNSSSPQVVIPPSKSPNVKSTPKADSFSTLSKKAKRRKTTSDVPEAGEAHEVFTEPVATAEKKKGRVRKKTATAVVLPDALQDVAEARDEQPSEVLHTIEPKTPTGDEDVMDTSKQTSTNGDQALPSDPVSKKVTATATSETPERVVKPSTNTPVSRGKISYRVGLSKRQRIAPLLRTLKK
jgi:hypothetical protein